jgi:hypothetical protein
MRKAHPQLISTGGNFMRERLKSSRPKLARRVEKNSARRTLPDTHRHGARPEAARLSRMGKGVKALFAGGRGSAPEK